MSDDSYPLFPTLAFLGFIAGLLPLPWHFQAWNAGTCLYMFWVSLGSLIEFVNSLVWRGNFSNLAPVYCDITTKLLLGASVGIPASSLCINRRLYRIVSMHSAHITREEKLRLVLEDVAIAAGIPVLVMILHVVVQSHRFNIYEDVGCTVNILNTPPAYPLVFMWPILLGLLSFIYAALTLMSFWRRRVQFSEHLSTAGALSMSRFLRLMLLCSVDMGCNIPIGTYTIWITNTVFPVHAFVSWEHVHRDFRVVETFSAEVWRNNPALCASVELGRWVFPFCAFVSFFLFGFTEEARRHYKLAFWAAAKWLGFHPKESKKAPWVRDLRLKSDTKGSSSTSETLPVYTPRAPIPRKSLSSSFAESDALKEKDEERDIVSTSLASLPADVSTSPRQQGHARLPSAVAPWPSPTGDRTTFASPTKLVPPYQQSFTLGLSSGGHVPPPLSASQALAQCAPPI